MIEISIDEWQRPWSQLCDFPFVLQLTTRHAFIESQLAASHALTLYVGPCLLACHATVNKGMPCSKLQDEWKVAHVLIYIAGVQL